MPNFTTKAQFQAWWMSELRTTWEKARWFYHYNDSHQREHARRPGMASQCPENQPLRHMAIMPAYLSKPVCDYLNALLTHWETRHGRKRPDSWQKLKKADSEPEQRDPPDSARSGATNLDPMVMDTLDPLQADWSSMTPKRFCSKLHMIIFLHLTIMTTKRMT